METYLFPKYTYIYKRSLNGVNHIMGNNTPIRHYKLLNKTLSTRNGVLYFICWLMWCHRIPIPHTPNVTGYWQYYCLPSTTWQLKPYHWRHHTLMSQRRKNIASVQLEASTLMVSVYNVGRCQICSWKRKVLILPSYNRHLPSKICSLVHQWHGYYRSNQPLFKNWI